jgi:hypothetical protein
LTYNDSKKSFVTKYLYKCGSSGDILELFFPAVEAIFDVIGLSTDSTFNFDMGWFSLSAFIGS